jgi:hypothetical protein
MAKLYNLARMTTATTGTGTITLGAAVSGYLTFALAGVANGETVSYAIKDGANSEIGTGVYTASGTTLARTVTNSTNSNAAIGLSGTAEVFITPRKQDLVLALEPATITAASANVFAVGANGTTNPVFNVDSSVASVATGINIKGAAAAGGVAMSVLSSGANENLAIDAKGSGTITIGGVSTGNIVLNRVISANPGILISGAIAAPLDATFNGVTLNGIILRSSSGSNSSMLLFINGGVVGSISSTTSATAYNTSSDARLKTNFMPYMDAARVIDQTVIGEFDWKTDGSRGLGVLAQDAFKIFPLAVYVGDDDLSQADARPWSVDYSKFVPVLLAEVKALRARVAALENGKP